MPQLETVPNPCPKCSAEFEAQRTSYCREFLRYQRENFAQRTEINALEVQLKHALEKLLRAERELIQSWKTSQQAEPVGDEWTSCMKLPIVVHVRQQRPGEEHVSTREGITPVKPDDLIMRGVSGEEYPIGRAIFEQTYSLNTTQETPKCSPA